jgi:hypothetical protein
MTFDYAMIAQGREAQARILSGVPVYTVSASMPPEEMERVLRDSPGEPVSMALFAAAALCFVAAWRMPKKNQRRRP